MEELHADYVVIGSGPSGQSGAIQAAKLGKTVIVIERDPYPGGAGLNTGTIPSKSLREAILDLTGFYNNSFYGKGRIRERVSINDLNFRLNKTLEEQRQGIIRRFEKNKIRFIQGIASFEDSYSVLVTQAEKQFAYHIKGSFFLIAAGSRPRNPMHIPFDNEVILDSTRLLRIDHVPKELFVLGGGVIGSEYASFFAALGTQVTVADKKGHMLPALDTEIGGHFQKAMNSIGLKMMEGKVLDSVVRKGNRVEVTFTDGTTVISEMLLYALGREADIHDLDIEKVGIQLNQKGYIPVNSLFQSVLPHIYAVGDVIGSPSLASTGIEQGRLATLHAFDVQTHSFPSFYPVGIYTIPEISFCGYTEEQLKNLGFRYGVGRAYYYEIARNLIAGNDPGMFKILFHADTLEILGVHIIGKTATELIHIGQVAMSYNARVDYFVDQIFNYPTYAEGYRIAALNGLNKIKRIKK